VFGFVLGFLGFLIAQKLGGGIALAVGKNHRVIMEFDLTKVYLGSMCTALFSLAEIPQPPSPAFGLIYEAAIGQPR
jgi:hypothetical protein